MYSDVTPARGASPAPTDLGMTRNRSPSTYIRSPSPNLSSSVQYYENQQYEYDNNNNNDNYHHDMDTTNNNNNAGAGDDDEGRGGRSSSEESIFHSVKNKWSSVGRSVSRAWSTFAASTFADGYNSGDHHQQQGVTTPDRQQQQHQQPQFGGRNSPRTHATSGGSSSNLPPLAGGGGGAQQHSSSRHGTKKGANYRRLLMAKLGMTKRTATPATPSAGLDGSFSGSPGGGLFDIFSSSSSSSSAQQQQQQQAAAEQQNYYDHSDTSSSSSGDDDDHDAFLHHMRSTSAAASPIVATESPSATSTTTQRTTRTVEELKQSVVDKRYWDPTFNATKAELESFPRLEEHELPKELRMLDLLSKDRTMQGRAVDKVLKQRLLENYPIFINGMSEIKEISGDLGGTAHACRMARQDLINLKKNFVLNGLKIPRLAQRKKRLTKVLDILEALELMQLRDYEMRQLIKECRFREALDLAAYGEIYSPPSNGDNADNDDDDDESASGSGGNVASTLLKDVAAAQALESNWKQMTESLLTTADSAWDQCFARGASMFSVDKYENIFETHALMGGGKASRVAEVVGTMIKESIYLGLVAASASKNITDTRQLVLGLEPPFIVLTVCQMAARIADAVATALKIERFHADRLSVSSVLEHSPRGAYSTTRSSTPNRRRGSASLSRARSMGGLAAGGGGGGAPSTGRPSYYSTRRAASRGGLGVGGDDQQQQQQQSATPYRSLSRGYFASIGGSIDNLASPHHLTPHYHSSGVEKNDGPASDAHHHHDGDAAAGRDNVGDANDPILAEQCARIAEFHKEALRHLRAELPRVGLYLQQELKNVAALLALESAHFRHLPIDTGLHVFYILAMAVDSTTHLHVDKDFTHSSRDSLRIFSKELVREKVYLPGCRNIILSLAEDDWKPLPDDTANGDLDIVTGITPKEYQEDRKAVGNFVQSKDETNPFLENRMLLERQDALDCLGTVKAKLSPFRNTVTKSAVKVSKLFFSIICRIVSRFPPLSAEVSEWSCDVYSMYLYVVASSMIGVNRSSRLQDHYDFSPKAIMAISDAEKWASNLYEGAFKNQNISLRVPIGGTGYHHGGSSTRLSASSSAPGGGGGGGGMGSDSPSTSSSSSASAARGASPSGAAIYTQGGGGGGGGSTSSSRSATPQRRAAFHIEQMPSNTNQQHQQPMTPRLGHLGVGFGGGSSSSSSSSYLSSHPQQPSSSSRTSGSSSSSNSNTIEIHITEEFPPPAHGGIIGAYASRDALFAVSERLNALESCYVLLEVLKQSVASVNMVVPRSVTEAANDRIRNLSEATDAIVHVGCHRLCHALFPIDGLVDEISGSRWEQYHGPSHHQPTVSEIKLGSWTNTLQQLCRNFFVIIAPKLKFASPHLRTAYWRHFVFNIQRALVSGFARSGRVSDGTLPVMRTEAQFVHDYLHRLFPHGGAFVREEHVFTFLDAFGHDLEGRIRWVRDNHEFYNSEDLVQWFMCLHSNSITRHQMESMLRDWRHSDCVVTSPFLAMEKAEEPFVQ